MYVLCTLIILIFFNMDLILFNLLIEVYRIYSQVIHGTVPIPLEGHQHEIECLHSSDNLVVSLCLGGKIYTWDSQSGEKYSEMDRSQ